MDITGCSGSLSARVSVLWKPFGQIGRHMGKPQPLTAVAGAQTDGVEHHIAELGVDTVRQGYGFRAAGSSCVVGRRCSSRQKRRRWPLLRRGRRGSGFVRRPQRSTVSRTRACVRLLGPATCYSLTAPIRSQPVLLSLWPAIRVSSRRDGPISATTGSGPCAPIIGKVATWTKRFRPTTRARGSF